MVLAAVKAEGGWPEALPLLPHPVELIVGLVAFAILLLLRDQGRPEHREMYAERTAAIEGGMQQAEEAQAEAKAALEKYNAQLADARTRPRASGRRRASRARAIVAEMREQAQAEAAASSRRAKRQIEAERQQAVASLRAEVGALATTLAGRIVGETLEDEARQRGVVDRFLADLEAGDVKPEKVAAREVRTA